VNNSNSSYTWTPIEANFVGNYSLEIYQDDSTDISPRFIMSAVVARPPPTIAPIGLDPSSGAIVIGLVLL
jgi:hypothetical protein